MVGQVLEHTVKMMKETPERVPLSTFPNNNV